MSTLLSNTIKPRSGDTVTFSSCNVSVGGTVTYEDVTNIDSVGIITAQTGIKVLAGGINAVGVITATSFNNSSGVTFNAGITTDAYRNTTGGLNAGDSFTSGSALDNTLIGYDAGTAVTTGDLNTAVGSYALQANTTGGNNTASCYGALYTNTTASNNTATGYTALYFNTTGTDNTATGVEALFYNTTGDYNTATGKNALYSNTTGEQNTASGILLLPADQSDHCWVVPLYLKILLFRFQEDQPLGDRKSVV